MILRPAVRLALPIGLALLTSCSYHRICRTTPPPIPAPGQVSVRFLGVSGFLVRLGADAVLTVPLYSNPTIGEIATQEVHSDFRLIDALVPRDLGDVRVVLSGHSHYDHLMDAPYVMAKMPEAVLYGNDEMEKLLAPLAGAGGPLQHRLQSLETPARRAEDEKLRCRPDCADVTGDSCSATRLCKQVGNVRIWPILSEHSPQFKIALPFLDELPPVHLWRGGLLQPAAALPTTPSGWVEGTTLAYLVDFMEGGRVAFRVYYQDSASREPYGFPPACVLKQRRVDLALLCAGGMDFCKAHPAGIVKALRPRFVIAGHWEDFFTPRTLPLPVGSPGCPSPDEKVCDGYGRGQERIAAIPGSHPRRFVKRLRRALGSDGALVLPCPDAWVTFRRSGDQWALQEESEKGTAGQARPVP